MSRFLRKKNGTFLSDFYSILVLYLTDVQWLEKKKPRQYY